jgi:hypothetical protein
VKRSPGRDARRAVARDATGITRPERAGRRCRRRSRRAPPSVLSRYLSEDEGIHIADWRREETGVPQIAAELGRTPSTISRELRRNAHSGSGGCRPHAARRRAEQRKAPPETFEDRHQCRAACLHRRQAGQDVEPAADPPDSAASLPRPAGDARGPRKDPPGAVRTNSGAPVVRMSWSDSPLLPELRCFAYTQALTPTTTPLLNGVGARTQGVPRGLLMLFISLRRAMRACRLIGR